MEGGVHQINPLGLNRGSDEKGGKVGENSKRKGVGEGWRLQGERERGVERWTHSATASSCPLPRQATTSVKKEEATLPSDVTRSDTTNTSRDWWDEEKRKLQRGLRLDSIKDLMRVGPLKKGGGGGGS